MARVVVDVMLKPEILDPQGQAVQGALAASGTPTSPASVRASASSSSSTRHLTPPTLEQIASTLLANTVIEDYTIHVEDA